MMPSDSCPCSAPLLLLSPPSLSPTALPTPGTASAGTGVGNWKGELQSTKAYQQAARESSAAVLGGPARGPERVGSLLFGGTGRTRMAALLRTGTAAVEAGGTPRRPEQPPLSAGAAEATESSAGGRKRHGTALGAPTLASCFGGSLRHGFLASEVPPSAVTTQTEIAAIFSYIFYSLTA